MRELDEKTLVSGQILPDQMAEIRRHGVTMIVNNRPDGEDPGQPTSAEIEAAAAREGLDYRHIPIFRGIGPSDVDAMQDAIRDTGEGKMLAYCRTGNRSTLAWAVAKAEEGTSREELERCAARVGVDLGPVSHLL